MPGKVTTYGSEAFAYLGIQRDAILDTAQRLGISAAAIAGAMAEERDAYARHPNRNLWLDDRAKGELASHDIIVNHLAIVRALGIADSSNPALKLTFPVLLDVGFGNFKFTTAIRLLEKYNTDNPTADPLNLKRYNNDYRQLLVDLMTEANPATVLFFGLMAKEAESFFENNADPAYWAGLTDEYKDGLVISYINFGQTTMNEKYAEALKKGPYRPELGEGDAGGESYFYYNVEAVRQALATPGPGAGVPLPLELAPGTPPVGGVVASQPEFQRGLTEATNAWWENPAPLTGQLLAAVTGGIKADLGLITSDVEDIQGFSELSRAIQKAVAGDVAGAATLELSDRTVWYLHADDAQGISVIGGDGTDDLMLGGTLADNLSGGDGADVLIGGAGADTLEGGAGDDILVGGLGDNQLRGGVGFDRYIVGRGQDTITDADGEGVIDTSAGRRIAGPFVKGSDGSYMSLADASVQASKSGDTLMITIAGGAQVVIENFTSGDLGIWLTDNAPTAPQPTLTILGDLTPVEPEQYDILGNLVVDPNSPAPDRADVLNGRDNQSEGDLIQSKGGDDVVAAKKGDDKVEAGTGSDIVNAGEGNDLVLGGADLDLLWGLAGNDRLYADRRLGCEPPRRQARQGNRLPVPPMETGERLHGEFRFSLALANRPVLALASRVPSASAGCPRRLIVSDQGHRTGGGAVIMRAAHRHPGIGPHHTTTPPLPRPDTRRGSSALSGGGHVAPGHLLCRSRTVPIGALPARIAR